MTLPYTYEGIVKRKGIQGFVLETEKGKVPMTTGNWILWFELREYVKLRKKVKIQGFWETVMFKRQFIPVRFLA